MEPFSSKSDLKNLAVSMLTSKRERNHESMIQTSQKLSQLHYQSESFYDFYFYTSLIF